MLFVLFACLLTCPSVGFLCFFAVTLREDFWRWAGGLKRWLREDLERKYGREEANELLGPPLPYEFFE